MIIRVAIALIAVLMCFNIPVYYDNAYTELANLRENAIRSLCLIIVLMVITRQLFSYFIAAVEVMLIACNAYIALNWGIRDTLFVAQHYEALQMGAYVIELAIIGVSGILGAAMIGTDVDSNSDRVLPSWFGRPHRIVRR